MALSLTREDLTILEDGVPQSIDVFQEAVLPVTFMLALDSSGSMKRSAEQAREAAREFIAAMRPEDQVGMILFRTSPISFTCRPRSASTRSRPSTGMSPRVAPPV